MDKTRLVTAATVLGALALLVYFSGTPDGVRLPWGWRAPAVPVYHAPDWLVGTVAGDGIQSYGGDGGPARLAQLSGPYSPVFDAAGNLYFADYYNHVVRAVDAESGVIRTVAGTGRQGFSGDGGPAREADLNGPYGLAFDGSGDLYVTDYFNQRVRRIDARTGVITTVVGNGLRGVDGDGGPALLASITLPLDIAVDGDDNLYISDWVNHRVRRIDARTGVISTIAGTGEPGFSGDGAPAVEARLSQPYTMAVDADGNVHVSDYENHRLRRVDARTGVISTVAGAGRPGFSGDGGPATEARIFGPYGIAFDADGHLFFADSENDLVRRIDRETGVITTVAGRGRAGYAGEGGPVASVDLHGPYGVAFDGAGNLVIAEYFNHRLRKVGAPETFRAGFAPPAPAGEAEDRPRRLARVARQIFGTLPSVVRSEHNPLTPEKVELGRALFFETRLSASGELSCATCHDLERYGVDGRRVSIGHRGRPLERNAPTVLNVALQSRQFWDARVATVEEQAAAVLLSPSEMAMPDQASVVRALASVEGYPAAFRAAFPESTQQLTFENVLLALGAFQRVLQTPSRFDRFMTGEADALTDHELTGLETFLRARCASCHRGPAIGGVTMGLQEAPPQGAHQPGGTFVFMDRLGRDAFFKVPLLRNVARTAPYLEDGSIPRLQDAISERLASYTYGFRPGRTAVDLTEADVATIVAFLEALTGEIPAALAETPGGVVGER